jgi:hypothetical protein
MTLVMHSRFLNSIFTNRHVTFTLSLSVTVTGKFHSHLPPLLHTRTCKFHTNSAKMARPSVYITKKINEEALQLLTATCDVTSWTGPDPVPRDELLKNIADKDALFCMLTDKVDAAVLKMQTNSRSSRRCRSVTTTCK